MTSTRGLGAEGRERALSDASGASSECFACPSCELEADQAFVECPRCGVVVAKALARRAARRAGLYDPSRPPGIEHSVAGLRADEVVLGTLSKAGWRAFRIGGLIALAVFAFPFSRFVFSYLVILIHELGHTAASWLFGYPALPSLDLFYGGGVSIQWPRSWALLALAVGMLVVGLFLVRRSSRALLIGLAAAAAWVVAAATPIHEVLIVAMGHGAELLAAAVFYYRAFSGYGARDRVERSLYAACAVFVNLSAFALAYRLVASTVFQRQYEQAKGGGHWMDFSRLAASLGVSLTTIAGLFLLASLMPFVAAWLWTLNRRSNSL